MDGEKDIKAMTPPKKKPHVLTNATLHMVLRALLTPPDPPPPARPTHER